MVQAWCLGVCPILRQIVEGVDVVVSDRVLFDGWTDDAKPGLFEDADQRVDRLLGDAQRWIGCVGGNGHEWIGGGFR